LAKKGVPLGGSKIFFFETAFKKMSKAVIVVCLALLFLVLLTPPRNLPAYVQTSNLLMVVVHNPTTALLNDLHVPGVSVVCKLNPDLTRERFELGQVIRHSTHGYEPYTLILDGQCRLVHNWLAALMTCLAVAHAKQFSAITQMPAAKGPTFPVMSKSGYHARVFLFPGRPYQSEVVCKRFLFGTSPVIKPFLKAKNATLLAAEHHTRVCNAVQWVVSGKEEAEIFGVAHDLDAMEKLDKFGH
jgi:hypothetical protein